MISGGEWMAVEEQKGRKQISNRELKSSIFTTYFGIPKRAAELYQALEHVEVKPEDIEFATLQGVMFMARKNDMAFTVKKKMLVIGEHQSTVNLNMPLRAAIYYGRTMEKLIEAKDIYKTGRILIPTPEFYVFYNGAQPQPAERVLWLSDSYLEKEEEPMLELKIRVININLSANHSILQSSRSLYEYSWFIQKIRDFQEMGCSRDDAVKEAMKACIQDGIMVDFIREHGSEVENMLFTEFNMDDALEVRYEEGVEHGIEKGEAKTILQLVCKKLKKGKTPEVIAEELEENPETIQKICTMAEPCGYDWEKIYDQLYKEQWD